MANDERRTTNDVVWGNGFVLAGGGSRRMGRDKATLLFDGASLIEHTTRTLEEAGLDVCVLVRPDQQLDGYRLLEDARPGTGPLGAILTALSDTDRAVNCFLPCDMPRVPARLFVTLAGFAAQFDVVVPRDAAGRVHHLCAQLSPACGPVAARLLDSDQLRVDGLLRCPDLSVRIVKPDEHGVDSSCFRNLNRPGDLP